MCFILCASLSSTIVFWNDEEEKKSDITDITYDGLYNTAEKISIIWSDFKSCKVKVGDNEVEPISESESRIELDIKDIDSPTGIIYIDCEYGITNREFRFPYIESVDIDGIDTQYKNITIRWKNLKKVTSVYTEWGTFKISGQTDTLIMWNVPVKIRKKEIYLTAWNLKSNEFALDIKIPTISHVTADEWFYVEKKVKIYWENIFDESGFHLFLWDEKITDYKIDKSNKFIEFTLWNKVGQTDIYILKNNFVSNTVSLNVHGEKLKITKVSEKTFKRDVTEETVNAVVLTAKNIPFNEKDLKVYHNWTLVDAVEIKDDEIFLNYLKLDWGNNYFKASVNGKFSNTVNKNKDMVFPTIVGIEKTKLDNDGNRVVTLNVQWFSSNTDELYYMWSKLPILGCYGSQCRVSLYITAVKGHFNVSRNGTMSPEIFEFDISDTLKPYIESISFPSWFKAWAPVIVSGNKIDGTSINGVNLFRAKDGQIDIKVTDSRIEWNLPIDFNSTLLSTLYVSSYWSNQKIDFTASEISGTKIYWPAIIDSIVAKKSGDLLVPWSKAIIKWKGIKLWDSIVFWDTNIKLMFSKWNPFPEFVVPSNIEVKEHKVKIVNVNNISSEEYSLYIYGKQQKPQLLIEKQDYTLPELITNKQNIGNILQLTVQNTVSKVRINSLSFNVESENYSEVWTFKLLVDNREVGTSLVNFDGRLTFDQPFDLYEWWKKYVLTLSKVSHFWEEWDILIRLNEDEIDAASYDRDINIVPIKIEDWAKQLKFTVKAEEIEKCVSADSNTDFCKKDDEPIKETETNTNVTETENTQEDNNINTQGNNKEENSNNTKEENKIKDDKKYADIDAKLEKVYRSYSRKPLRTQIKVFKSLSFQLNKLLNKTKQWARRDAIEFIYHDVNNHYKSLFKQYILTKKKS